MIRRNVPRNFRKESGRKQKTPASSPAQRGCEFLAPTTFMRNAAEQKKHVSQLTAVWGIKDGK